MKKLFTMLLLCAAVVLASCSKDDPTPDSVSVAFSALTANGSATESSTALTLTFDKAIEGLVEADITLTAGDTGAVKGALTAKGSGVYELALSGIVKGGEVTVAVAKTGYTITPASKTVTVNYYVAAVAVRDFYYDDNTFSTTLDAAKKCVGIVFWVDPADVTKGKIVSLDEGVSQSWGEAQSWKSSKTLPSGMTWSCPTKDELQYLYCGYIGVAPQTWGTEGSPGVAVDNAAANAFNAQLTAAGGVVFSYNDYWSSTVTTYKWIVDFMVGFANPGGVNDYYSVRAISTFATL